MQFSSLISLVSMAGAVLASPYEKYFGLIVIRPGTDFQNSGVLFNPHTSQLQLGASEASKNFIGYWRPDRLIALPEGKFMDVANDGLVVSRSSGSPWKFNDNDVLYYEGSSAFVLRKNGTHYDIYAYENNVREGDTVVQLRAVY